MNISFAITTAQVKNETKDVTRRTGWWRLRAGQVLQPVEKSQGLRRGEHVRQIGRPVRVVDARREFYKSTLGVNKGWRRSRLVTFAD